MRYFFVSLLLILSVAVHAQTKLQYSATLEASLLKGNSQNSNAFLFTNGLSYKSWTTGVGAGLDNYVYRSLPLFIDIKKTFGRGYLQSFVNASAGVNINEAKDDQKFQYFGYQNVDYKNGFYARAMAGISLPVNKKLRVFFKAGYSYKTTHITYASYAYPNDLTENTNTDVYWFNRWSLSAGFWF